MGYDRDQWLAGFCEHGSEPLVSLKGVDVFDRMPVNLALVFRASYARRLTWSLRTMCCAQSPSSVRSFSI